MTTTKKRIVLSFVLALILISSLTDAHFVRGYPGGTLLVRGDEAFLFLGTGKAGYRFRYVEYPFLVMLAYFHVPNPPEYQTGATTVIRITPSSIERKTVDFGKDTSHAGNFFTPFYDGFYAMCDGGQLCKWSDAGFEPATPEEQRQFGGVDHLVRGDMNNKNINGWSVYEIARSPGNLQVSVGGKFTIAIDVKATFAQGDAKFSIYLLRPGRPEETLYVGDGTPKLISAAEYKRDFPPGTALKE